MEIKLHPSFQLNGTSFKNVADLLSFSKSISESTHAFFTLFFDEADAIKLQTSGSTGTPKIIEIKKEYMVNSAIATGNYFSLQENTTALLCMNPNFIAGKMMLVRALILGWKIDVVEPSLNPLKGLNKSYSFSAMVPLQVSNSLDDLHKIKKLIIGGGAISNSLEQSLQKIKTECFATYGMTETVSHIAVRKLNNYPSLRGGTTKQPHSKSKNVISSNPDKYRDEKSHYDTLPNITISTDQRNCLVINAPKITKNQIITNDIVALISDSEFKWLGRFDNIINSGGIKLISEQIEEKLSKIIEQRFFVAGIPDELLGEKLVLVVEGQSVKGSKNQRSKESKEQSGTSTSLSNQKNLKSQISNLESLSKYEIPKEIYFLDAFIETSTKKIQRKKTLDLLN